MSRVQDLTKRQTLLNETVAALEVDPASIDTKAHLLDESTCTGRPYLDEWKVSEDGETFTRPARGNTQDILFLTSLLEVVETVKAREHLEAALVNLKTEPADWVEQLELQAQFDDSFSDMRTLLEAVDVLVRQARLEKRRVNPPSRSAKELVKDLHPRIDTHLDNLVVLTCPGQDGKGRVAHATTEQYAWLKGAKLLFKRAGFSTQGESIGRKGSDYFYLLHHIESAGVLEEQDFYTSFELGELVDLDLEDLKARRREHELTLEPSNRFAPRGLPIDEYTVDIDETIVETD